MFRRATVGSAKLRLCGLAIKRPQIVSLSSLQVAKQCHSQNSDRSSYSNVNWALIALAALGSMGLLVGSSESEGYYAATTPTPANLSALLHDLSKILHADQIELDEGERRVRGKPWNSYHTVDAYPHLILYPTSTEQVSQIVRLCIAHNMPIVAFGGGTSLEGQTLTLKGGVSLDFSHMKDVSSRYMFG